MNFTIFFYACQYMLESIKQKLTNPTNITQLKMHTYFMEENLNILIKITKIKSNQTVKSLIWFEFKIKIKPNEAKLHIVFMFSWE